MNSVRVPPGSGTCLRHCTDWEDSDLFTPVVHLMGLRPTKGPGCGGRRGKPPLRRAELEEKKEQVGPLAPPAPDAVGGTRRGAPSEANPLLHILISFKTSLQSLSLSSSIFSHSSDSFTLFLETLSTSRTFPSLAFFLLSLVAPSNLLSWILLISCAGSFSPADPFMLGTLGLSTQNSFLLALCPFPWSSHPPMALNITTC